MSDDRLIHLSEKLSDGDAAAAEEIFLTYAPYLRMVVRRQLTPRMRTRFDSNDVVQSVWADTLLRLRRGRRAWRFRTESRLRSFLVRLTRNRFIDFYRRNRASLEQEMPLSSYDERSLRDERAQRPSEVVQADELWARLLSTCPPARHELLRLKRQGLPLVEIAARTGLHESSVRRILYELAARLVAEDVDPSALPGD
jgi:RNA polymerase sigma factor (sigma-70 family)